MSAPASAAQPLSAPPAPVVVAIGSSADGFQNLGAIAIASEGIEFVLGIHQIGPLIARLVAQRR